MKHNQRHFEVIVIGGGPAGISGALWCAELGLSVGIFERERELGGQLLWTFGAIENYLGIKAENGRELSERFLEQIEKREVTRFADVAITGANLIEKAVAVDGQDHFSANSIVIATGVRRRQMDVPGESDFAGRGILTSGVGSRDAVAGKRVVIVGGGDAALENALILSEVAGSVTVVHRRDTFSAREAFVKAVSERGNVTCVFHSRITAITGNTEVEAVGVSNVVTGEHSTIAAAAVLIRIGVEPNTELFQGQIDLDERGYVVVAADCSTSLSGVFAAGDVANPISPTIATAVGMGATAAKAIKRRR